MLTRALVTKLLQFMKKQFAPECADDFAPVRADEFAPVSADLQLRVLATKFCGSLCNFVPVCADVLLLRVLNCA